MAKKATAKKKYPRSSKDVPVTQRMLFLVRDELKEDIKGHHKIALGKFAEVDGRFIQLEAKMDSKFAELDSRFHRLEGQIHGLTSEVHRLAGLIEEQNARNSVVLDGLTNLFYS